MVNSFEGRIVTGEPAGARVIGTDHFTVRPDGVGTIEARELVSTDRYQTSAEVYGYATPPAGLQLPSLDVLLDPDFTWPDAWFTIDAFALYRTAAPGLVGLNRTAVSHRGRVNMGTGELLIEGRAVTAEAS
ncbi:hypothetical protein [Allosalinactinospora lopnorensis]|uniref:hypothetical protein n=1 Tax=Allosalinactinospora lopnorensis TaxID=1352348 RepID=UPI000623E04F|nr:hypothetical protein [Allosalinactinospora lopnorensis]